MVHLNLKFVLIGICVAQLSCQKDSSKKGRKLSSDVFKYRDTVDTFEDPSVYYDDDYENDFADYYAQDYAVSDSFLEDRMDRKSNKYVPFNSLTFSEGKVSNNRIKVPETVTENSAEATSPWWKETKKR